MMPEFQPRPVEPQPQLTVNQMHTPSKMAVQKELMKDTLGAYVFTHAPKAEWITDAAKCDRTIDTKLEATRAAFIQQ